MKWVSLKRFNFGLLNSIHLFLFEKACPKCGVYIQKNGGCSYMQCQGCKHEFCWLCKSNFAGHHHQNDEIFNLCLLKFWIGRVIIFFLMIFLDFKIGSYNKRFLEIQGVILNAVLMILFFNLQILSMYFQEGKMIKQYISKLNRQLPMQFWFPRQQNIRCKQTFKNIAGFLKILLVFAIRLILNYLLFTEDDIKYMLILILIEIGILLIVISVILIKKCIVRYQKQRKIVRVLKMRRNNETELQRKIRLQQEEVDKKIANNIAYKANNNNIDLIAEQLDQARLLYIKNSDTGRNTDIEMIDRDQDKDRSIVPQESNDLSYEANLKKVELEQRQQVEIDWEVPEKLNQEQNHFIIEIQSEQQNYYNQSSLIEEEKGNLPDIYSTKASQQNEQQQYLLDNGQNIFDQDTVIDKIAIRNNKTNKNYNQLIDELVIDQDIESNQTYK
ncbi:ykr017c-like protein [Stylonychia lemnae]|uniref:Ykr017c-like protein n=1 Tax=Stylonychia lemnae TaxID=5949 RepID=A0A078AP49_STYLE|nr:ykr017c-like protein [Stylonychia lemnae]|eukprot:CDW82738.1 ykr017c-like protein [Stylonychia lemnae]